MDKNMGFTLAKYNVKPGMEEEFIERWNDLAKLFSSLPKPPLWGTLIRSLSERTIFYSFGPWNSPEDVQEMRKNSDAAAMFRRLHDLCTELSPGDYEIIQHVIV